MLSFRKGKRREEEEPVSPANTDSPGVIRRRKALLSYTDIKNMAGVEIGPYDRPIVMRDMANILYADLRTTEELKDAARYGKNRRDPGKIVDVDLVISKDTFELPHNVDFIVASHVLEHVPDPVGWLNRLGSYLNPCGFIFLAVPDRRFTFDHFRSLTSLGLLLEKCRLAPSHPSPEEVFDAFYYHVSSIKPLKHSHSLQRSLLMYEKAVAGEYVGCHCNVFESNRFRLDFQKLIEMGALELELSMFESAVRPYNDFLCAFAKRVGNSV